MGLFSGISSAIGGIASTILGNNSAKHEAERNRDWQEDMSNTSIQRRVADLKAAGFNPLLAVSSASSGASTPSGGQANIQRFDPSIITALSNAYLVDKQGKVAEAEARKSNADAERIENDNTLFKYKEAREVMFNQLQALKINTEKLQHDILRSNNLKTQSEIVINTLKSKGIKIDNEQAKIVLSLMKEELGAWENTSTAKNYEYITGQVGRFTDWVRSIADVFGADITQINTNRRGSNTYTTTTHSRRYW